MKKVFSTVIAIIMLLAMTACGTIPTSTKNDESTGSSAAATEKVYAIGETADLNGVKAKLVGVTEATPNEYMKPDEGKVFILCEFAIENGSDKDLAVSSMMSFDSYADDTAISISLGALAAKGSKEQLDGSVAAGKKMNGVIGYEVAKDWKTIEISFTPNLSKDTKATFKAEHK